MWYIPAPLQSVKSMLYWENTHKVKYFHAITSLCTTLTQSSAIHRLLNAAD